MKLRYVVFVIATVIFSLIGYCAWFTNYGALAGYSHAKRPTPPDQTELLKTFMDEFVEITPGEGKFPRSFSMGNATYDSQSPTREITFNHTFHIAKYEVPQDLYQSVMKRNTSRWRGPRKSVETLSWENAQEFCQKITTLLHDAKLLPPDESIRLPSEAEWEYCCRAGTTTAYSFGDSATSTGDSGSKASLLDPYAWHTGNAAGNDPAVGSLKPNPWGLYDMHGYLWEFTADDWHESYKGAPAGPEPWIDSPRSKFRTARGGSWKDKFERLTSSMRDKVESHLIDDALGFRCVRAKTPPAH